MTTQWSTRGLGQPNNPPTYDESLGDDGLVLLMQGKNSFGDRIYSYLKLTTQDLRRLQAAIQSGTPFNPSDYGTVVAAGKGEPSAEIKAEIESTYKVLSSGKTQLADAAPKPEEKNGWDEF